VRTLNSEPSLPSLSVDTPPGTTMHAIDARGPWLIAVTMMNSSPGSIGSPIFFVFCPAGIARNRYDSVSYSPAAAGPRK
jgi:hypothetical protein